MTRVIPFSALVAPFPRIFHWIAVSIAENDAIAANGASKFLAKEEVTFIGGQENLVNNWLNDWIQNPPDWMILGNRVLISLSSVSVLLKKAFLILILLHHYLQLNFPTKLICWGIAVFFLSW